MKSAFMAGSNRLLLLFSYLQMAQDVRENRESMRRRSILAWWASGQDRSSGAFCLPARNCGSHEPAARGHLPQHVVPRGKFSGTNSAFARRRQEAIQKLNLLVFGSKSQEGQRG